MLNLWMQLSRSCGWWQPFKGVVFVCERPAKLNLNEDGRLHSSSEAAMLCRDGWPVYALNGVRVPSWLVLTPTNKLNPRDIETRKELKENVEVRREFIRKIGIERCLDVLGWEVLSKEGNYELGETRVVNSPRRYLKMLNPSLKVWHLEAVHPSCSTVQEAINWRRYGDKTKLWQPYSLS